MSKIAVIYDMEDNVSDIFKATSIHVFSKDLNEWKVISKIPVQLNQPIGVGVVRSHISLYIASMDDCRAIVGSDISGVPYNTFDAAGFSIFQLDRVNDASLDYLDSLLAKEDKTENIKAEITQEQLLPEPTGIEGCYRLDLIRCLSLNSELSSKKLLIPFLKNTSFYSLEVICSHIPPWLALELEQLKMISEVIELDKCTFKVVILNKTSLERS